MSLFVEFKSVESKYPIFVRPSRVIAILEEHNTITKAVFTVILLEDGHTVTVKEDPIQAKMMIDEAWASGSW